MKRLAKRTIVIAAVLLVLAAIVGGAAYGFFTSGQTIANNEIKAGSIELSVNDGDIALPVLLPAIMPGDYGTAGSYKIENIGDTPGTLWVGVYGNDNGVDKFFDEGLAQALEMVFWLDVANDGVWSTGDKYFVPNAMYQEFQSGDAPAVPAVAYKPLSDWNNGWSNTLPIPGASTAGNLKVMYNFPSTVDNESLMGKKCNFDLLVEIHQIHPMSNTITLLSVSGHTGATWNAYSGAVLVDSGTVGANGYSFDLPVGVYDIVFTQGAWTWTKHIDITVLDQSFDLPV